MITLCHPKVVRINCFPYWCLRKSGNWFLDWYYICCNRPCYMALNWKLQIVSATDIFVTKHNFNLILCTHTYLISSKASLMLAFASILCGIILVGVYAESLHNIGRCQVAERITNKSSSLCKPQIILGHLADSFSWLPVLVPLSGPAPACYIKCIFDCFGINGIFPKYFIGL